MSVKGLYASRVDVSRLHANIYRIMFELYTQAINDGYTDDNVYMVWSTSPIGWKIVVMLMVYDKSDELGITIAKSLSWKELTKDIIDRIELYGQTVSFYPNYPGLFVQNLHPSYWR